MSCSHCEIDFDANDRCPRVMSCGHVFCSSCLKGLQKHQPSNLTSTSPITTFTCPRDSVQVRVPSSCPEDAIRALPREREILEMYEAAHLAPPRDRQCEVCDEDAHVATHHCVDCDQYFCSSMAKAHKKIRGFGAHIMEAIGESGARAGASQSNVCWDGPRPTVRGLRHPMSARGLLSLLHEWHTHGAWDCWDEGRGARESGTAPQEHCRGGGIAESPVVFSSAALLHQASVARVVRQGE